MTTTTQGVPLELDADSRRHKILYGCALLAVALVCAALTPRYGFWPGLVAFLGLLCGGSTIAAARKSTNARGACPSCGGLVSDVDLESESVACAHCGDHALIAESRLLPTPPDHVARSPIYVVPLEAGAPLPVQDRCVGCCAAATHTVHREVDKTAAGVKLVARLASRWTIAVPLCEAHARPDARGLVSSGVPTFQGDFGVRSYRYWRMATKRG